MDSNERASAPSWYALRVHSRAELKVEASLKDKQFEVFLPLSKERKRYCDRFQVIERATFPGYVFCRFSTDVKSKVLTTYGVVNIVSVAARPAPIPDSEIESLRVAIALGAVAAPFAPGQKVQVRCGSAVIEGVIKGCGEKRLIVGIQLLGKAVELPIDEEQVAAA